MVELIFEYLNHLFYFYTKWRLRLKSANFSKSEILPMGAKLMFGNLENGEVLKDTHLVFCVTPWETSE